MHQIMQKLQGILMMWRYLQATLVIARRRPHCSGHTCNNASDEHTVLKHANMNCNIAGSSVMATPERSKSANMVFTWQEHAFKQVNHSDPLSNCCQITAETTLHAVKGYPPYQTCHPALPMRKPS